MSRYSAGESRGDSSPGDVSGSFGIRGTGTDGGCEAPEADTDGAPRTFRAGASAAKTAQAAVKEVRKER